MRYKRIVWFGFMILLGMAAAMTYGWLIRPVNGGSAAPNTLRADYQADYVLMVAEILRKDTDLPAARQRLVFFEPQSAEQVVSQAIVTAQQLEYPPTDLEAMVLLMQQLQSTAPTLPTATGAQP